MQGMCNTPSARGPERRACCPRLRVSHLTPGSRDRGATGGLPARVFGLNGARAGKPPVALSTQSPVPARLKRVSLDALRRQNLAEPERTAPHAPQQCLRVPSSPLAGLDAVAGQAAE